MERSNKPPPLSIPTNPPAYLSALSYHRTPSGHGMPSAWTTSRRRNLRKTFAPCGNTAGVMFIAFLAITGTLTWLLIRGGNSSSPLSRIPVPNHDPATRSPGDSTQQPLQKIPEKFPVREIDEIREPGKANSTLNFQQIFAINLPSRLDRKDTLTLMAAYSNLSITIVPGVRTLADNALPPPRKPGSVRAEEYAVWRAHANVWRRIIEDDLTTALILEDDNDWDINLKEQVPRIMKALEEIQVAPPREEDDGVVRSGREAERWDMLYLGSCWETATLKDKHGRKTVVSIPSDRENVAKNNYNWVEDILRNHKMQNPPTRLLQRASLAQCTHAYALTSHGARKLLFHTSLNLDKRLDMAIADLVKLDVINAFSVIPPVMVQWKTTERASKDTDVGYEVWPVRNWGFAHSVRYRLRKENQVGYDPSGE